MHLDFKEQNQKIMKWLFSLGTSAEENVDNSARNFTTFFYFLHFSLTVVGFLKVCSFHLDILL